MTQEEKAKAYDEALEIANAAYKDEDRHLKATLERIFPELKESEDERIRKELIEFTKTRGGFKQEWIAWLEKQGESYTKKDVDDAYVEGMIFAKKELEKQGGQKPTDGVESITQSYITPNKKFFQWIYDRLVHVHNENPNVDYMLSLKKRIEDMQNPANDNMKEALQTEYEKGRADVIADTLSWLENCWPKYCSNQTIIEGFKEAMKE